MNLTQFNLALAEICNDRTHGASELVRLVSAWIDETRVRWPEAGQ